MTITDVHFAIGKTHEVCQDYGLADDPDQSGLSEARAFAVVCDGCSSSPDTDWGARFLARAASTAFKPFNPLNVIQRADLYRSALQLHPHSLDATLLLIQETPEGDAEVIACGDGVVVARRRDGSGYDYWVLSFSLNAPAYLSYLLDASRLAAYQQAGGGIMTITGTTVVPNSPDEEDQVWVPVPMVGVSFHRVFSRAEYDVVLVMTDGAESFQRREGTRLVDVPVRDVITQVLDLKVLTHGFLRRRMGRFLTKFCPQMGWQHYDDFAVAGMILDPPKEAVTP